MVDNGLAKTGYEEVGLLSLSSADHCEIAVVAKGLADRYEGTETGLSLPSTRVDAFNIDLANELTRNGRRSGLTFAPEGGSERMRKVINKMVTEEDLIRTVATAYGNGWRPVKLYFMCGLPTETDEDVLQIAELASRVIETGRQVSGTRDIRCTVSIGGFVPKPHTPFQWAAQLDHETTDARLRKLRDVDPRRPQVRQVDRLPLPRRQARHRRGTALARRPSRRRRHRAGLARRRPLRRLERALLLRRVDGRGRRRRSPTAPVDVDWFTTREREQNEVLPWDHLDSGLDKDWLWEDWQDALAEVEVEDCRWTPCFDCGVCDQMGTEIQVGPTGVTLLGMPALPPRGEGLVAADRGRPGGRRLMARQAPVRDVAPTVQRLRLRYAKRGRLRFTSTRDFQRALERALRRTGVPMAYSQGFNPHPRISYTNAAPTGTASEAEYVELAVTSVLDPEAVRAALDEALPPGLDVLEVVEVRAPDFAERLQASVWVIELPGVDHETAAAAVATFLAAEVVEVQRLTKSGMRTFDARQPVLRLDLRPPTRRRTRRRDPVRYSTWSSGTSHRPSDPMTSSPRSDSWPTSCRRSPPG